MERKRNRKGVQSNTTPEPSPLRPIRLSDAAFADRLVGKYGWAPGAPKRRAAIVHRDAATGVRRPVRAGMHVDVHVRLVRPLLRLYAAVLAAAKAERRAIGSPTARTAIAASAARTVEADRAPRSTGPAGASASAAAAGAAAQARKAAAAKTGAVQGTSSVRPTSESSPTSQPASSAAVGSPPSKAIVRRRSSATFADEPTPPSRTRPGDKSASTAKKGGRKGQSVSGETTERSGASRTSASASSPPTVVASVRRGAAAERALAAALRESWAALRVSASSLRRLYSLPREAPSAPKRPPLARAGETAGQYAVRRLASPLASRPLPVRATSGSVTARRGMPHRRAGTAPATVVTGRGGNDSLAAAELFAAARAFAAPRNGVRNAKWTDSAKGDAVERDSRDDGVLRGIRGIGDDRALGSRRSAGGESDGAVRGAGRGDDRAMLRRAARIDVALRLAHAVRRDPGHARSSASGAEGTRVRAIGPAESPQSAKSSGAVARRAARSPTGARPKGRPLAAVAAAIAAARRANGDFADGGGSVDRKAPPPQIARRAASASASSGGGGRSLADAASRGSPGIGRYPAASLALRRRSAGRRPTAPRPIGATFAPPARLAVRPVSAVHRLIASTGVGSARRGTIGGRRSAPRREFADPVRIAQPNRNRDAGRSAADPRSATAPRPPDVTRQAATNRAAGSGSASANEANVRRGRPDRRAAAVVATSGTMRPIGLVPRRVFSAFAADRAAADRRKTAATLERPAIPLAATNGVGRASPLEFVRRPQVVPPRPGRPEIGTSARPSGGSPTNRTLPLFHAGTAALARGMPDVAGSFPAKTSGGRLSAPNAASGSATVEATGTANRGTGRPTIVVDRRPSRSFMRPIGPFVATRAGAPRPPDRRTPFAGARTGAERSADDSRVALARPPSPAIAARRLSTAASALGARASLVRRSVAREEREETPRSSVSADSRPSAGRSQPSALAVSTDGGTDDRPRLTLFAPAAANRSPVDAEARRPDEGARARRSASDAAAPASAAIAVRRASSPPAAPNAALTLAQRAAGRPPSASARTVRRGSPPAAAESSRSLASGAPSASPARRGPATLAVPLAARPGAGSPTAQRAHAGTAPFGASLAAAPPPGLVHRDAAAPSAPPAPFATTRGNAAASATAPLGHAAVEASAAGPAQRRVGAVRLDVAGPAHAPSALRADPIVQSIQTAVKTVEAELEKAKELWAKPKIDVARLTDQMYKELARRLRLDEHRRGF